MGIFYIVIIIILSPALWAFFKKRHPSGKSDFNDMPGNSTDFDLQSYDEDTCDRFDY